jgi:hypothetical protein
MIPDFDHALLMLCEIRGIADLDPDAPMGLSGSDSLDIIEWAYQLCERIDASARLDLGELAIPEDALRMSPRQFHARLRETVAR